MLTTTRDKEWKGGWLLMSHMVARLSLPILPLTYPSFSYQISSTFTLAECPICEDDLCTFGEESCVCTAVGEYCFVQYNDYHLYDIFWVTLVLVNLYNLYYSGMVRRGGRGVKAASVGSELPIVALYDELTPSIRRSLHGRS